eukprot:c21401_g1_i1.p1 GENE.c21401_g1_i1~~c21401_g1_i1.p1  ORF type:complete len:233 (+),score=27.03 c21401_g1_i1:43-699(+)
MLSSLRTDSEAFLWPSSDLVTPPSAPFALAMPAPPPPSPLRLERLSTTEHSETWESFDISSSKRRTDKAWKKWEDSWDEQLQAPSFRLSVLDSPHDFPLRQDQAFRGLDDQDCMRSLSLENGAHDHGDDDDDDTVDLDQFIGVVGGLRPSHFHKVSPTSLDSAFKYGNDECSVCLEVIERGETCAGLRCGHEFHSRCLRSWFKNSHHCPNCRFDVEAD